MNEQEKGARKRTGDVMHAVGLTARLAVNSYGEPVCISAHGDKSIGLTIYMSGERIAGVQVTDPSMGMSDDRYMLTNIGLVPTNDYDERAMTPSRRQT